LLEQAFAEAAAVIAEALRKPSRNLRFATSRFKRNKRHSSGVDPFSDPVWILAHDMHEDMNEDMHA